MMFPCPDRLIRIRGTLTLSVSGDPELIIYRIRVKRRFSSTSFRSQTCLGFSSQESSVPEQELSDACDPFSEFLS